MSSPVIHPSSSVAKTCDLADDVVVGPHCVLSGRVRLGPGVRLTGGNYVNGEVGPVTIGARTKLWPHACVGFEPQDYKFNGVTGGVVIGEECMLREGSTVHCSTKADRPTVVGNKVFMMVNTHVAHDCIVGDRVVMVNGSALAGHCEVGNDVTLCGNAVIHQFCRIGRMVMMSGDCGVNKDVPPFCIVSERNRIGGLNLVGLRRNGVPREQITVMTRAFKDFLYRPMIRSQVVEGMRGLAGQAPLVGEMAEFLAKSTRGFVTGFGKPPRGGVAAFSDESEE
jgi:UDP-N-acetylglucosamine acyltransferase